MEKVLNKLMIGSIIMSAVLALLGIVLLVVPDISWIVISYTLATLLIVGRNLFVVLWLKDVLGIRVFDGVTPGIISFLLGLIIFLRPIAFATLVPLILGVWFITTECYSHPTCNVTSNGKRRNVVRNIVDGTSNTYLWTITNF